MLSKQQSHIYCSYIRKKKTLLIDREIKFGGKVAGLISVFDKPERVFYKNPIYHDWMGITGTTCRFVCRIKNTLFISSSAAYYPAPDLHWSEDGILRSNGETVLTFYTLTYAGFLSGVFS